VVCEGEKAADAIAATGLPATTSAGGSKGASKSDWKPLRNLEVCVLPDHDEPGEHYADEVAGLAIKAGASSVRIARFADRFDDLPAGGDAADVLEMLGGDADALREAVEALADAAEPVEDGNEPGDGTPEPPAALDLAGALPGDRFEPLRDYIEAVAEAMQVAPDAVALLALPIMTTGSLCKVEVDPGGWREIAALWSAVLMPSGERKSALFAELAAPVVGWERGEAQRLAPEIARSQTDQKIAAARLKKLEERAAKTGSVADAAEAGAAAEAVAALPAEVVAPRLFVTEPTPEALARDMARNGERALVAGAEGDSIDVALGRYSDSRTAGLGPYLVGHAGDAWRSSRITRENVDLARPALALALAVQPIVFGEALSCPAAVRRGMVARYLTCAPASRLGERKIRPARVPEPLRERAWAAPLRAMLNWPMGADDPIVARFDEAGQRAFDAFRAHHERRLCPRTGDLAQTDADRVWASKLAGAVARLAFALACWDAAAHRGEAAPPAIIGGEIVTAALSWSEWLVRSRRHAEAVALAAADPEAEGGSGPAAGLTAGQRKLVAWIADRGGRVTPRDLTRGPRRFRGASGTDRARDELQALADAGAGVFGYERGGSDGPDSMVFRLGGPTSSGEPGGGGDESPAHGVESRDLSPSPPPLVLKTTRRGPGRTLAPLTPTRARAAPPAGVDRSPRARLRPPRTRRPGSVTTGSDGSESKG